MLVHPTSQTEGVFLQKNLQLNIKSDFFWFCFSLNKLRHLKYATTKVNFQLLWYNPFFFFIKSYSGNVTDVDKLVQLLSRFGNGNKVWATG